MSKIRWDTALVCGRPRAALGLAFYGSTQNAIDDRLTDAALGLETGDVPKALCLCPLHGRHQLGAQARVPVPLDLKANAELLFGRGQGAVALVKKDLPRGGISE